MKYIPIQLSWALLLKWCATHAKDDALNGSGGGCAACGHLANARRPGDSGDDGEDSDELDFELKEELQALFEGPLKYPEQASAKEHERPGGPRTKTCGKRRGFHIATAAGVSNKVYRDLLTTKNFPEIIRNVGIVI
ncbi:hypothetical protein H1R20_g12016, partial [Candolleomyces eurysporus]